MAAADDRCPHRRSQWNSFALCLLEMGKNLLEMGKNAAGVNLLYRCRDIPTKISIRPA